MDDPRGQKAARSPSIAWTLAPLALFVLALVPRLNAVWQGFITPDEPFWVFRSVRFMSALEAGRWIDTFQIGHPGVITMWMGTLGIWWQRWREASATATHLAWVERVPWIAPENAELYPRLIPFLAPARVAVAALTSLGVVGTYALARRLWDRRLALAGAALIALDPFVIGLSGLLHVDALAMTFMTLSLLAWLGSLHAERVRGQFALALLSGVCAGLGLLSKSLAVSVAAVLGVVALLSLARDRAARPGIGSLALLGAVWTLGLTAATVAAFPAMWVDPLGTMQRIVGLASRYSESSHRITFFRGVGGGDPGPLFYPTVLLFRLTPITLPGLALSTLPLFAPGRSPGMHRRRALLISLWVLVVSFTALISVSAKKLDRYLLPVFPALDLLAAAGWIESTRWLYRRLRRGPAIRGAPQVDARSPGRDLPQQAFAVTLVALLAVQGAAIAFGWPYYLDAYNPLAGGIKGALRTLPVGWGEGLEQMADYMNRQPDAVQRVVAGGGPVTLGPLLVGRTLSLDESSRFLADSLIITALDRQIYPQRVAEIISGSRLTHVVRAGGREVLWLYETQDRAEADHLARYGAPGDVVLCDAPSPFARHAAEWNVQLVTDADEEQAVDMLNDWSAAHTRLWYLSYQAASPIMASILRHQLETYAVPLDQVDLGYVMATLYILPEGPDFSTNQSPFQSVRFAGGVALVGGTLLDEEITSGQGFGFRLRWRATATPQADYVPFVHLIDPQGHLRTAGRGDELLVNGRFWPTSFWSPGDGVELDYGLGLPAGLPPGRYQIVVGLADAQTGAWMPILDSEEQVVGVTAAVLSVDVQPAPTVDAGQIPTLPHPSNATWDGRIQLLGYDHPSASTPGKTVVVELDWLGLTMPDVDYALRLSLVAADGQTAHTQVTPLSTYPTSRWRAGEWIHELYDLRLPAELTGGAYELALEVLTPVGDGEEEIPLGPPAPLGSLQVSAEARLFELPRQPQYPLEVRLGQGISLLGYDLPLRAARAGDTVPLTLYWRCEAPQDTSYTVFVHLLDADQGIQGQQDRTPLRGHAPTSGWVEGQIVVDEYRIPISDSAQPGPHRIEVGMYDPTNMVRLPAFGPQGDRLPQDRVLLETDVVLSEG